MADTNTLKMGSFLRQTKNPTSRVNNRWFAYVDHMGNLTARGLAEYLVKLGVALDRGELEKIIIKLSQAIPEIVAQGYGVKMVGLGIFYASIKNKKGGAASVEDFKVGTHIKGVRFGFRPSSTDLDDLTVKAFGKHVTFGNGYYVEEIGKKAPRYPLAAAGEQPEP